MTFPWLLVLQKRRLANPWTWVGILVFGLPFFVMKMQLIMPKAPWSLAAWASTVFVPFLLSSCYVWASPIPWLWTGQGREPASFFRGAFQSVVFALGASLVVGLLDALLLELTGIPEVQEWGLVGNAALQLIIMVTSLPLVGYLITRVEQTEHDKLEAERHARDAQWILLRGQLSPHMLFNALNGLAELVHQDPRAAEQGLLDLSTLYRALLHHGGRPMAPLGDERALVERYLAVEQMRLGRRLRVHWDWEASLDRVEVPPFLVQPAVENALKHGINPAEQGGEVRITLARTGRGLLIRVANNGLPLPLMLGDGIGVQNLQARLSLAYGPAARHRLYTQGAWTISDIHLDLSPGSLP